MVRLISPLPSIARIWPGPTKRPRLPARQRLPLLPAGLGTNPATALVTKIPNWPVGRSEPVRVTSLLAARIDPEALIEPVAPVLLATAVQKFVPREPPPGQRAEGREGRARGGGVDGARGRVDVRRVRSAVREEVEEHVGAPIAGAAAVPGDAGGKEGAVRSEVRSAVEDDVGDVVVADADACRGWSLSSSGASSWSRRRCVRMSVPWKPLTAVRSFASGTFSR